MRTILSTHAKIPIYFLYLETRALPIKSKITSRKLNYLKQPEHELIKRIFSAQREDQKKGGLVASLWLRMTWKASI